MYSEVSQLHKFAQDVIGYIGKSTDTAFVPPHLLEIQIAKEQQRAFEDALEAEILANLAQADEEWEKEFPERAVNFLKMIGMKEKEPTSFSAALRTILSYLAK